MAKAEGLSMGVIIIAAIGLIVLVVLTILVINSGVRLSTGTTTCVGLGDNAQCVIEGEDCPEGTTKAMGIGKTCPNEGEVCCGPSPI